jgi:hypothetical protein
MIFYDFYKFQTFDSTLEESNSKEISEKILDITLKTMRRFQSSQQYPHRRRAVLAVGEVVARLHQRGDLC